MRGAYQSTGLALVLLALVWFYRTLDLGDDTISSIIGYTSQDDVAQGSVAATTTQVAEVIPVATPGSAKTEGADKEAAPKQSNPARPGEADDAAGADRPKQSGSKEDSKAADRPLITYAYSESASARENLKFFIAQGLHDAADFIFILNGKTDAANLIPKERNVQIVLRPNECFDLGAHGEVLRKDNLWRKYKRFIALNASIRGPFIPYWAKRCWSDVFLSRVTEEVKLVGMTANCLPQYHIQSMIWATDSKGLELLLYPPPGSSTLDKYGGPTDMIAMEGCYKEMHKAIHGEIGATGLIQKAGYKVDALMAAFHKSEDYQKDCQRQPVEDILWNGQYYGGNVHPYETVFMKANRDIDPKMVELLTEWHLKGTFGGSWDVCRST